MEVATRKNPHRKLRLFEYKCANTGRLFMFNLDMVEHVVVPNVTDVVKTLVVKVNGTEHYLTNWCNRLDVDRFLALCEVYRATT